MGSFSTKDEGFFWCALHTGLVLECRLAAGDLCHYWTSRSMLACALVSLAVAG